MRRIIISIIGICSFWGYAFSANLPFDDVKSTDSFYEWVKKLYEYWVIQDDGSKLFHPEAPITRDTFIWFATSVSCKKCITPTTEDIIKYTNSPFPDLEKINPYYYCIAYAQDTSIVQWYTLNSQWNVSCQDNTKYSTPPLCPKNNTSRIEAVAMLLRQSWLWNDAKNANTNKTTTITDVSDYWYGYAQKWIQAWILSIWADNTIKPNEAITRWEFAQMAAKMLSFNQCVIQSQSLSIDSSIVIRDNSWSKVTETHFPKNTENILTILSNTNIDGYKKTWKLTHIETQKVLTWSGNTFPTSELDCWKWIVENTITQGNEIKSKSTANILILCQNITDIWLILSANPTSTVTNTDISFTGYISWGKWTIKYLWDFGNGETRLWSEYTKFRYNKEGTYLITLTASDSIWNIAQSSITIKVDAIKDKDNDGITDDLDICPEIIWIATNKWCPELKPYSENTNENLAPYSNSRILDNVCIMNYQKNKWLILGSPMCDICPCNIKIDISSIVRSCDIIFPSILSPDNSLIYIRWWFYQIQ